MKKFHRLKKVPYSAGNNTGAELSFAKIPAEEGGKTNYCRSLRFRLKGNLQNSGEVMAPISNGAIAKLFKRIRLELPNMPRALINLKGVNFARMYRQRNRGRRAPGTGSLVVNGGQTEAIDFALVHQFRDPRARRAADFEIPAALLHDGTLTVEFANATDLGNGLSFTGTLEVTAELVGRRELVLPSMTSVEELDIGAGQTEPNIDKVPGKITHLCLARQNGALLGATEHTEAGLKFGTEEVSDTDQDVAVHYDAFNEGAEVQIANHTAAGAQNADDAMPLVGPSDNLQGQRTTYETADGTKKMTYKTDDATNGYTFIRRLVWDGGAWERQAKMAIGIPLDMPTEAQTASHKGTQSEDVKRGLPKKAKRAA